MVKWKAIDEIHHSWGAFLIEKDERFIGIWKIEEDQKQGILRVVWEISEELAIRTSGPARKRGLTLETWSLIQASWRWMVQNHLPIMQKRSVLKWNDIPMPLVWAKIEIAVPSGDITSQKMQQIGLRWLRNENDSAVYGADIGKLLGV